MAIPSFTHIVPLGANCRLAYQVRTYFATWKVYPFDWWISPLDGLRRYLADPDPGRLFAAGALEEMTVQGRAAAIRSREYGFQLFHEFPRRPDPSGATAVKAGWQSHVAAAAKKHRRLLERLLGLNRRGNVILFVRHLFENNPEAEGWRDPSPAIASLWEVLLSRWGQAEPWLLLINIPAARPPADRVLILNFDDPPGMPPDSWKGETWLWQTAFASLDLTLRPRFSFRLGRPPQTPKMTNGDNV